eukprot:TRINITY_DN32614_c0_g1_i1.p1 TRINITY_DN32614_c0_g1~~TRINITY_DN32614_c0_g1_i1.p1  ORF type:complete len:1099 (+),score=212.39 TRINITY_DN32614_c0_g1_i1:179-3475(+)
MEEEMILEFHMDSQEHVPNMWRVEESAEDDTMTPTKSGEGGEGVPGDFGEVLDFEELQRQQELERQLQVGSPIGKSGIDDDRCSAGEKSPKQDAAVKVAPAPEDEDEAEGWEIIQQSAEDPPAYNSEYNMSEMPLDEIPEDLIMGCLDPECWSQFGGEKNERQRCAGCRLFFCEKHVKWLRFRGRQRPSSLSGDGSRLSSPSASLQDSGSGGSMRKMSSSGGRASLLSAGGLKSPRETQRQSLADAVLGLLATVGQTHVLVCGECRALMHPPGHGAISLGPKGDEEESMSSCPSSRAPSPRPSPREALQMDAQSVAAEITLLSQLSLQELLSQSTESTKDDGPESKTFARNLLERHLGRLHVCLRPWTEAEREWVWRLRNELLEAEHGWVAQFVRQATWDDHGDARDVAKLISAAHMQGQLPPREALQVLCGLGRCAASAMAAGSLGDGLTVQRLAKLATCVAENVAKLEAGDLSCCLELLLDAAEALSAAGCTTGCDAVMAVLKRAAQGESESAQKFQGELFWALETRSATCTARGSGVVVDATTAACAENPRHAAWASVALQELLGSLPMERQLGLLWQQTWVRHVERGEIDAARGEPGPWRETQAFPLAVWPPRRRCLGLEGQPKGFASKSKPLIVRCRYTTAGQARADEKAREPTPPELAGTETPSTGSQATPASTDDENADAAPKRKRPPPEGTAGLLLKRDNGMHQEQQVGQTLRLLERLIWEDPTLVAILKSSGLQSAEEVRATYTILMTGVGTAIIEFVEGARTLREVRAATGQRSGGARGRLISPLGGHGNQTLREYLAQHNDRMSEMPQALMRLACTAAVSAVLSFVAGLGDRHHENFMVTTEGRILHVDYGFALGREPLDSILIHLAIQGGRPVATLQFEELNEALGPVLTQNVFWPVAEAAYLVVRRHAGLLVEMVYAAMLRDLSFGSMALQPSRDRDSRVWSTAQSFVARRCALGAPSDSCAKRFVKALLRHCAQHERGAKFRDELKDLDLRQTTQHAVNKAYNAAAAVVPTLRSSATAAAGVVLAAGRSSATIGMDSASSGMRQTVGGAPDFLRHASVGARTTASELYEGVKFLLKESSKPDTD